MRHLLTAKDLSKNEVLKLFERAEEYQRKAFEKGPSWIVANLFFEPSTRTKMSFTVAQKKLGYDVLDFSKDTSSVTKGESFYDTVKTIEAVGAQMLVIRHSQDDWPNQLVPHIQIPMINAGAGKREHPTQSLLDAYTIYKEFGTLENIKVAIAGDIKHSRVAHSNLTLLSKLGAKIYLSSPEQGQDVTLNYPYISMDEAVEISDVLMLLRIQHERHEEKFNTNNYLQTYGLTVEREQRMKKSAILLHPAPVNRDVEIDSQLVEGSRSRIFQQMTNGVYVRMAIMRTLQENWEA